MSYIMAEEMFTPTKTFEKNKEYPESELPKHTWEAWVQMRFCKEVVIDDDISRGTDKTDNDTGKYPDQAAKRVKTSRLVKPKDGLGKNNN